MGNELPFIDAAELASGQLTTPAIGLAEREPGAPKLSEQQPAQILYTSGTIDQPKGVLLSQGNLLSNARAKLAAAPQFATDVRLNILPFAHAYARTCELSTWILSGSQLCIAPDWNTFLSWALELEPTLVNLVPQLVYRLVDHMDATASEFPLGHRLRLLQVGGAALRPAVWKRLAARGWPPLQGYGLTETSPWSAPTWRVRSEWIVLVRPLRAQKFASINSVSCGRAVRR